MFEIVVALALGYLVGSLPSAALVARLRGRTIFEVGSGNMGAMNTARNLGWGWGALVLALDVGKGAAATALGMGMAGLSEATGGLELGMPLAAGLGAVIGHAWSAYVGLRGGKGLATTLGVSLPLYPLAGLFGLGLMVALVLLLRRANLAAVLTVVAYPPVAALALLRAGWQREPVFAVFTGLVPIAVVVLVKHALEARSARAAARDAG